MTVAIVMTRRVYSVLEAFMTVSERAGSLAAGSTFGKIAPKAMIVAKPIATDVEANARPSRPARFSTNAPIRASAAMTSGIHVQALFE